MMENTAQLDTLNDKCFSELLKLIHELTGITISQSRKSMVQGRLRKRVGKLSLPNYDAYLEFVRKNPREHPTFIDLVTTNETYFFRTPRVWDYIEKTFLPAWIAAHPNQVFMAWSSASSSGEEAHSLGIICQSLREKNPGFLYQIVGTDISQEMVGLCQKGQYSGRTLEQFRNSRPELFQKYMKEIGGSVFQATPEIRSRLRFNTHNLFNPSVSQDKFDLVLCRNVLIYFTPADQEKVLDNILMRMTEKSMLIVGESESLTHIRSGFKYVEPLIYSLKETAVVSPGLQVA